MSTEWIISSRQDKRLVSTAATSAHVNMPAVCADKAWHYVLLSLCLSARDQLGSTQMQEMYLYIRIELGGKTLGGSADSPMTQSRVKETSGKATDLWQKQESVLCNMSSFH